MADAALKVAVDVILFVIVTLPFAILEFAATPSTAYQRGLYCDDESIRYPYKEDTISDGVLILVGLAPPIIAFCVIEWFLYKQCHGDTKHFEPIYQPKTIGKRTAHPYLVALYSTLGPFAFGVSTNLLLTNAGKFVIGRFRPHFVSVCKPDWSQINCTDSFGEPMYVQNIPCLGTDEHLLTDARLSFPSGHASFSAFCYVYIAIYLQCRMIWTFSMLLRPFLQLIGLTFAFMCALTRVSDYKHHPTDILAGGVLGSLGAILVACYVSDLMKVKLCKIGSLKESNIPPDYGTNNTPTTGQENVDFKREQSNTSTTLMLEPGAGKDIV